MDSKLSEAVWPKMILSNAGLISNARNDFIRKQIINLKPKIKKLRLSSRPRSSARVNFLPKPEKETKPQSVPKLKLTPIKKRPEKPSESTPRLRVKHPPGVAFENQTGRQLTSKFTFFSQYRKKIIV